MLYVSEQLRISCTTEDDLENFATRLHRLLSLSLKPAQGLCPDPPNLEKTDVLADR
jgi:hypothetical protein